MHNIPTTRMRVVADSNVVIAAHRSAHPHSPNREFIERWQRDEFDFLYSVDTLSEYAEKLLAFGMARADVKAFLSLVSALGEAVEIDFFHLPRYPTDADDIAFLLCAWNGRASHLVTYDRDLLDVAAAYAPYFRICPPLDFLVALRHAIQR